jgi:pilus assembly protein Flp/PilA
LAIDGIDFMDDLNRIFPNLLRDESGQDLIEYALVAALVGLGATASMKVLATAIGNALTGIGSRLTTSV